MHGCRMQLTAVHAGYGRLIIAAGNDKIQCVPARRHVAPDATDLQEGAGVLCALRMHAHASQMLTRAYVEQVSFHSHAHSRNGPVGNASVQPQAEGLLWNVERPWCVASHLAVVQPCRDAGALHHGVAEGNALNQQPCTSTALIAHEVNLLTCTYNHIPRGKRGPQ